MNSVGRFKTEYILNDNACPQEDRLSTVPEPSVRGHGKTGSSWPITLCLENSVNDVEEAKAVCSVASG